MAFLAPFLPFVFFFSTGFSYISTPSDSGSGAGRIKGMHTIRKSYVSEFCDKSSEEFSLSTDSIMSRLLLFYPARLSSAGYCKSDIVFLLLFVVAAAAEISELKFPITPEPDDASGGEMSPIGAIMLIFNCSGVPSRRDRFGEVENFPNFPIVAEPFDVGLRDSSDYIPGSKYFSCSFFIQSRVHSKLSISR